MTATRTGRSVAIAAAVVLAALVFALPTLLAGLLALQSSQAGCGPGAGAAGGPPSQLARTAIPADLPAIFRAAERQFGVPWNVLAAINKVETNFGRDLATSSAGAQGWMQFMPDTWARYGLDGDHDGRRDPNDPRDAIPAAANYLRASGAPQDLHRAIFAYNHAEWYVAQVLSWTRRYAQGAPLAAPAAACATPATGVPGKVTIAPGANLPGRPIAPETMAFLARVAGAAGRPLVVTTGTNHSRYTVNGNVSDHWDGHAADIGMAANGGSDDSPVGDRIATACLIAAGDPPARAAALARAGGLWTWVYDGLRIQCIWKTDLGGNHHNHVHIGARPEG